MDALVIFIPLLGSAIAGLIVFAPTADKEQQAKWDKAAQWVTCVGLVISMILSWILFKDVAIDGNTRTVELFTWIQSGSLNLSWAIKMDTLTVVMMFVVTTVSAMVHIYSIGYMHHDNSIPRFMSYLSLFTFFMLMLVSADNLVQMFFGWEGVGLASYLLIGFWYDKPSANAAAIKAFLVNRIGDFGFLLGIFTVFMIFGSVNMNVIFADAEAQSTTFITVFGFEFHALTVATLLLFVGAMGKSAQLGLHTWLPDAMEGPTPVSALIHAATMVTAGVFMVARFSPLFEYSEVTLTVVTFIGGATAIFAATVACTQNDIKRVIAYSTCSQLGYMFFASGVSAYSAGIFHLMTHGFFKALLFLGAGAVIHAMSDEQDMRRMGGIWKLIPVTYALMWIGNLSLAGIGIPGLAGFSGFYSKDVILEAAYASNTGIGGFAFVMGVAAAFLTAFYSWRLLIMTFHGKPRADDRVMAHVHESPKVMILPLLVLAAGAIFAGYLGYESFVGAGAEAFWGNSIFVLESHPALEAADSVPTWVKEAPLVAGILGIALAYYLYMFTSGIPQKLAERFQGIYLFLLNKWYFDELYDKIFVRPAFRIGRSLWKGGDGSVIDGVGPDGVASAVKIMSRRIAALQSGYLYHYAFAMLIGIVVLTTMYLFSQAG